MASEEQDDGNVSEVDSEGVTEIQGHEFREDGLWFETVFDDGTFIWIPYENNDNLEALDHYLKYMKVKDILELPKSWPQKV